MEPRISLVTLGVSDLERAVAFYRDGLGFPTTYKPGDPVAFFNTGGARLAVFPRAELAHDIGPHTPTEQAGFSGISLAHNVRTEAEVAAVLELAAAAGGAIIKPAQEIFFGRHGYFSDPHGYYWEVAWNPSFPLAADGMIQLTPLS